MNTENEIIDANTGAYTETYFRNRLEEELHRASFEGNNVALMLVKFEGLEGLKAQLLQDKNKAAALLQGV